MGQEGSMLGREECIYRNRVFAVYHSILLLRSVSDIFGGQKEDNYLHSTILQCRFTLLFSTKIVPWA